MSEARNDSAARQRVELLRQSLTDWQREILSHIWESYCDNDKWISTKRLHNIYGKPEVQQALRPLSASVVWEMEGGQTGNCYQLSILGIFLTDQAKELEELLVRYLGFLRDKFRSDPDFAVVANEEVEAALGLSSQKSQLLVRLITIGHMFGGSTCYSKEKWTATPIREVDDLPSVPDLGEFLFALVLRHYNPDLPVYIDDRRKYLSPQSPAPQLEPADSEGEEVKDATPNAGNSPADEPDSHLKGKPPALLENIKWVYEHGLEYKWYVLAALVVFVVLAILSLGGDWVKNRLEKETPHLSTVANPSALASVQSNAPPSPSQGFAVQAWKVVGAGTTSPPSEYRSEPSLDTNLSPSEIFSKFNPQRPREFQQLVYECYDVHWIKNPWRLTVASPASGDTNMWNFLVKAGTNLPLDLVFIHTKQDASMLWPGSVIDISGLLRAYTADSPNPSMPPPARLHMEVLNASFTVVRLAPRPREQSKSP